MEVVPDNTQVESSAAANASLQEGRRDGRKRQRSQGSEDGGIDSLFPAAAAMKKRRVEAGDNGARGTTAPAEAGIATKHAKRRKQSPEVDVIEVARQQREAKEEAARKDAEVLQELIQDPEISKLRNLAIIEEMEIKARSVSRSISKSISQSIGEGNSGRWREEWTGRKNFKKFRRKGESQSQGQQPIRSHRVIVPLEEVKKKGYGMGDEYWLGSGSASRRNQRGGSENDDNEDDSQFRHTRKRGQQQQQKTHGEVEDEQMEDVLPGVVIKPTRDTANAETAHAKKTRQSQMQTQTQTQTQAQTQGNAAGKRKAAAEPAGKRPPPKKTRGSARMRDEDESASDDDELRFKFRRRKE